MKNPTYNYDTQQWEDSKTLQLQQLQQERELISGPHGAEFIRFTGSKLTAAQALANLDSRITALN